MISANTRNRSQAISTAGRLCVRYFAVTSDVPRNRVDARISAMPRNGRSTRASAEREAASVNGGTVVVTSSMAAS